MHAEQAYCDLFVEPHDSASPQKVDVLSPPTFFMLAAHAYNILLCPRMDIRIPGKLSEYVRACVYVQSPFLRFKVLQAIIEPRVRRIVHRMHADGTAPSPAQQTIEEIEWLGERVCALLCEHAYSADSLLALRTACAEQLPAVTHTALAYLSHFKEEKKQPESSAQPAAKPAPEAPPEEAAPAKTCLLYTSDAADE